MAERYLLLTLMGLDRWDAVGASLLRVEDYALAAAFDALRTSEFNEDAAKALMRRDPATGGSKDDKMRRARYGVKQAALESIGMSARLLAEMAMVRPAASLPELAAPPIEPLVDETVMSVTTKIKGKTTTTEYKGCHRAEPVLEVRSVTGERAGAGPDDRHRAPAGPAR